MQATVSPRQMQSIFDVHQYELTYLDRNEIQDGLDGLARQLANFPVADLHILIEGHARSNDVSIKLSLILPGRTIVASDRDTVLSTAFDRCSNRLLLGIEAYKSRLDKAEGRQKMEKGTLRPVHPSRDEELETINLTWRALHAMQPIA